MKPKAISSDGVAAVLQRLDGLALEILEQIDVLEEGAEEAISDRSETNDKNRESLERIEAALRRIHALGTRSRFRHPTQSRA